ncbi:MULTISPECIES: group II intron reverse transcriptase/maturase [Methylomonas]|uniref:Group II intron reverse transcriptase/maturase n=1 Tax=Methylomonas koyamae TaxID=702114 RepID=A0A177N4M6_9GAMM|nr:group II intron reverse transcriptase/maturase [Methylomonas koyamae]OAI12771.1 group II intron reverse transcriptase/maturase [Methylomonas koyamae]
MNVNFSVNEACASSDGFTHWHGISWRQCEENVKRLQTRIVKATQEGRWGKVKSLQWLLTHSQSAKALAVKRVTENQGKNTAGVDGETWNTPEAKLNGLNSLKRRGYQSLPLRRVEILKKNGKKRKLGIPTIKDRAMQALYLAALQPIAETLADRNSYGFRPERSTADAREEGFKSLNNQQSAQWILEGDIKGCFDNIDHDWLMKHIPMDKQILKMWLKAGCIFNGEFIEIEAGTPQGGIISPTLANMALDGLEMKIDQKFASRTKWDKETKRYFKANKNKVNFIRYADDFVITGVSKELLENEVKPLVEEFLKPRGLELSPEKTKVVNIADGFDFLGWNFRKYDEKLLIKPSDDSVKSLLTKVRGIFDDNKTAKPEMLILKLNPILSGWAEYHKGAVSCKTFAYIDNQIWLKTWQWAKRRHPKKGRNWIKVKYFTRSGNFNWTFYGSGKGDKDVVTLFRMALVKITRHIKIKSEANPFDPKYEEYFESRLIFKMKKGVAGRRKLAHLWLHQNGICPVCNQRINDLDNTQIHHILEKAKGGPDILPNLIVLHPNCHRQVHSRGLTVGKPGRASDF